MGLKVNKYCHIRGLVTLATVLAFLMLGNTAWAGDYSYIRNPVQHYINLHIAGGEVSPFLKDVEAPLHTFKEKDIITGVGADAALGLSYEIRYRRLFVNVGAEFDADYQNFILKAFTDTILRDVLPNKNHTQMIPMGNKYTYEHRDFWEKDYELRWAVPIQIGYLFNSYFYGAVGMKYSMAVANYYKAHSTIQTGMILNNAMSGELPMTSDKPTAALYGVFPSQVYDFTSENQHNSYDMLAMLTPSLEIGARLPIAYRTILRVGAYVQYGIPLNWTADPNRKHVVYDGIWELWDQASHERTQQDIQDNLGVNPLKNSDWTAKGYRTLSVGVRLTFSFNVTAVKHWCNCENDLGVHPVRSAGAPKGRIMKD